ncbi:MAG: YgjV family protein, partial [Pseudomonadota bacterium]
SGLKLRLLMLATCSLWLIHNAAIHSIGGTLLELGNVTLFSWRALKMRKKAV